MCCSAKCSPKLHFQIAGKCFVLLSYVQIGHIKGSFVQGFEFDSFSAAPRLKLLPYRQEDTTLKVVWVLCSCTMQPEHPQNPHTPTCKTWFNSNCSLDYNSKWQLLKYKNTCSCRPSSSTHIFTFRIWPPICEWILIDLMIFPHWWHLHSSGFEIVCATMIAIAWAAIKDWLPNLIAICQWQGHV